jgi:hypothetical protein
MLKIYLKMLIGNPERHSSAQPIKADIGRGKIDFFM